MATVNILQLAAGTVQALSSLTDASINVADRTSNEIEASITLTNIHSCMQSKLLQLYKTRDRVKAEFQIYWLPKKQFDPWLEVVEATNDHVRALTEKFSYVHGFAAHLALSKEIESMCIKIDEVITEGRELGDALVKRETKRIVKMNTQISTKNISALNEKLELILECLEDGSINAIRLHGEVGTGKRAIIEHLNNHKAIANNMFEIILWVPALENENHDKSSSREIRLQHIIANRLGLSIEGSDDVNIMASKIHAELDGAKYLLILDDLKADIRLKTVGIPNVGRNLNYEKDVIQQHEIGIIARKVVKWCDGLFPLIKIVAENFKSRRSPESWSDGLQMLRKPTEKGDIYMQALENFLHFSYHGLEDNQKICFLFCALYPEDSKIPIDCLFDCWKTHKFVKYGNVEKLRMSEQQILEHLIAMSLLKEDPNKQSIIMDRVFRGTALRILQQHDKCKCLVADEALEKLENNGCTNTHWISLAGTGIQKLPTKVTCPKLTALFLQKNSNLKNIPDSFFDEMDKLLVLDLSGTNVDSLLPMCKLLRLKLLYANDCKMCKVLPLGIKGLDDLEVLDIRGTTIKEIPDDIKKLKHLRRLMVSILVGDDVEHLKISELSSMRELIIDVKSDIFGNDKHLCNGLIADIIKKIDTFKELTMLQFRFSNCIVDVIQMRGDTLKIFVPTQTDLVHVLGDRRFLRSNALQVYIGLQMEPNYEIPKCFYEFESFVLSCESIDNDLAIRNVMAEVKAVIFMKNESIEHLHHVEILGSSTYNIEGCVVQRCNKIEKFTLSGAFTSIKTLVLSKCSRLKELFSSNAVMQQVMGVEHLEIRDCSAIEEINMLSGSGAENVFPKLTTLVLYNLRMLTKICLAEWALVNTLLIHMCPELKELPLTIDNARKLHKIKVEEKWWNDLQLADDIKQKFQRCCEFRKTTFRVVLVLKSVGNGDSPCPFSFGQKYILIPFTCKSTLHVKVSICVIQHTICLSVMCFHNGILVSYKA